MNFLNKLSNLNDKIQVFFLSKALKAIKKRNNKTIVFVDRAFKVSELLTYFLVGLAFGVSDPRIWIAVFTNIIVMCILAYARASIHRESKKGEGS